MSKVVYIASAGHSGSTLLDMIIGSIPRVFSTGEVKYLPWQLNLRGRTEANVENLNVCSCLKKFSECEVWSKIVEELNKKVGFNIHKKPYKFNLSILSSQILGKKLRISTRGARFIFSRCLNFPFYEIIVKLYKFCYRRIVKNNWLLFDTICDLCDVDYIVDSTKDYNRFKLLYSERPDDVYLIVLKRDFFGYAYSHLKRDVQLKESLEQQKKTYDNIMKVAKHTKGLKYLFIEYEKLCENPIEQRKRTANFLNLPNPGNELHINTQNYHIVAGNPMRYKGKITIRLDERWKEKFDEDQKENIRLIKRAIYKEV